MLSAPTVSSGTKLGRDAHRRRPRPPRTATPHTLMFASPRRHRIWTVRTSPTGDSEFSLPTLITLTATVMESDARADSHPHGRTLGGDSFDHRTDALVGIVAHGSCPASSRRGADSTTKCYRGSGTAPPLPRAEEAFPVSFAQSFSETMKSPATLIPIQHGQV